ncbi:hypothetical protein LIER_22932 [Lithospermum erythrorhizon]|uniref:Uncharacterized protein n=1 Tax=Lithospermum erythrorhizon TaxID=34254 RepID=A0AAV3QX59_LITER
MMKFRSWVPSICTDANSNDSPSPPPPPKHLFSDSSTTSTTPSSSLDTTSTMSSSLESNLSILTLPSVPSLQKLSPENLNLSVSTLCITSINPNKPLSINFLAMNKNLLYAASGSIINVYETINFTLVDTFNDQESSSGAVKSITFLNGKIFSAHQDCRIRVWKLIPIKQHKLVSTLPTINDRLRHVLLPKNYVKVRRHKKKLWVEHHDAVSGLAVASKGCATPFSKSEGLGVAQNLLYSISWDRSLKIWDKSRCIESIKGHDDAINAVVVSCNGTIFSGSADRRIKVWDKPFGEKKYGLVATLEKHKSAVNALALSNDGSVLFSGSNDRSILVWEREDSANYMVVTGALRGHSKAILCLVNLDDLLFSGSADRTIRIWQRGHDGRYCCLSVLDGHRKPVKSVVAVAEEVEEGCESNNNGVVKVFSGSFDGEIKVWQVVVSSARSLSPSHNM